MTETVWLWIGTLGMIGGSALLFLTGGRRTQDEEGHTIAHGIVPLIAAVSYLAMALHQGSMTLPFSVGTGEREFLFARYIDWSLTTPILLLGLTMTALHGAHRRAGLVAGLLASDVVMILTGLFYGMSVDPFAKWMWFITSCAAFLAVYYILFGAVRAEAMARDSERRSAYSRNVPILSVLWLLYPIFVFFGPDGVYWWSATFTTALIIILDLTSKVAYGFISMAGSKKITDADLTRGEVSPAMISTHAVPSGAPVAGQLIGHLGSNTRSAVLVNAE